MDAEELKTKTKQFAIDVGRLSELLPETHVNIAYKRQIIRSSSSTGANYRGVQKSKV
ncbi:four helix bundle protein [Niabella pedocola]|uniref:four helix bundle protein n=1 Tax=Niabella pedocola TaxID=1752077 RepID=UPI00374D4741